MFFHKIWIICRVCLRQQEEMYNLFDDTFSNNIWSLLRDCGGVPVRKNDEFPDQICETCLGKLRKAIDFRMDCQRGHRELIQKIMKGNEIMHEEKYSDSSRISNKNSSKNSLVKQQLFAKAIENKNIEHKNSSQNIHEYSLVTQKEDKFEKVEQKKESQLKKSPIVLLLKLKDKPHNKNEVKTIKTAAEPIKSCKPKKNKQTVPEAYNATTSEVIRNSIKTIIKSKLDRRNVRYACSVCKKIYQSDKRLRLHMNLHKIPSKCKNKGRRFKCDKCNKIFRLLSVLRKHARIHTPKNSPIERMRTQ